MPTRPHRVKQFREQMGVGHKLFLLPTLFGSMVMRDFVALHMTWGAINELTTLTALLPAQAPLEPPGAPPDARPDHPGRAAPLRLLPRAGEGAHDRSPARRRIVRWALKAFWTPVGAGVKSEEEVDALALYLFGDSPEGRAGGARDRRHDRGAARARGPALLEDCARRPRCRRQRATRGHRRRARRSAGGSGRLDAELAEVATSSPTAIRPPRSDVGAQAAAVHEPLQHAGLGELLEVAARVAQPPARRTRPRPPGSAGRRGRSGRSRASRRCGEHSPGPSSIPCSRARPSIASASISVRSWPCLPLLVEGAVAREVAVALEAPPGDRARPLDRRVAPSALGRR